MTQCNKFIIVAAVVLLDIGNTSWAARKSPPREAGPIYLASKASTGASNAATNSQQKYASIPFMERHAILQEIKKEDLASIYRIWLEAGSAEHDLLKQGDVASLLATALRERKTDPELVERMRQFIIDGSNSNHDRSQLISILGDAQTKETADVLLTLATTPMEKEQEQVILYAISRLGTGGGNHEDLSPALERLWRESNEQSLLICVALAIAQVGAPSGVNLLLDSALAEHDFRRRAAEGAFEGAMMFNPNAVPPLAARLASQPVGSSGSKLVSDRLARITTPAAAKALLNWLQEVDESASAMAHDYVVATTSPAQLQVWESALNPAVPFRSEKNREAIRGGLAEFHQDHGY